MPILADLSRRLHFLTTDAKPDPPRIPIPGATNNLPPSPDEQTQKSLPATPEIDKTAGGTLKRQQSTPDPSPGEPESSAGNGNSSNNGSRKNSKESKNPRFKTKVPIRNATAQTANIVNYNIINSHGVKIGATKTYVCNINQCAKNAKETCEGGTSRATKTKAMPKAVEDLSTSAREINLDDIFLIKTHIGHGWRDVVRRLGYSEGQLDQFEENYSGKGIDEVIYQAFLDWKQANTKDAQIGILIRQMWSCREYDCAQRLAAAAHETTT